LTEIISALHASTATRGKRARYPLSFGDVEDLVACRRHDSHPFVAAYPWRVLPSLHIGVDIAAADPASLHSYDHVVWFGGGISFFDEFELALAGDQPNTHLTLPH
jgi:hypothetical protein